MNTIRKSVKPSEIVFLNNNHALYSCDMRSIGESMEYDIPAMWKYENIIPWVLKDKNVLVNEVGKIIYKNANKLLKIPKGDDAKISIYERLKPDLIPSEIDELWVAVPHPDADEIAKHYSYKINYSYSDFMDRNDKLKQKELLGEHTPNWKKISNLEEIAGILQSNGGGYIKRKHGSGGFTVFKIESESNSPKLIELFKEKPNDWYFEEMVTGVSKSVQCLKYKDSDEITLFGYSEQMIDDGKYFTGSRIKLLSDLEENTFQQLNSAIKKLSPILKDYEGFFGLDFITNNDGKVLVLEANVRLTAATIPTLLVNQVGDVIAEYHEDYSKVEEDSVILTIDQANNTKDVLIFSPKGGQLGKTLSFQLAEAKYLNPSLKPETINEIRNIVDQYISKSNGFTFENFWPFGWTICFVLEESHCAISSWYLERKILFDIFSCAVENNFEIVIEKFSEYFGSSQVLHVKEDVR